MDRLQAMEAQLRGMQGSSGSPLAGLNGMMTSLLLFWLVWPVLCGVLGASRGKAASGFFHGLMWGPFGLIPVLVSSRKYVCPTCGCQTLKAPHDVGGLPTVPTPLDALTVAAARPARGVTPVAAPPVLATPAGAVARRILDALATPASDDGVPQSGLVTKTTERQVQQSVNVFTFPGDDAKADRESVELHMWVNGEKVT